MTDGTETQALAGDNGSDNAEAQQADPALLQADDGSAARIAELETALADATTRADTAETALAAVTGERDALKAKVEAASKAPRARQSEKADRARKIGPVEEQAKVAELLEAIGAAGKVEIAFSDGKRELSLAPIEVAGDCWAIGLVGLQLRLPELLVRGPGDKAVTLGGYGLLLDGKQVAFAPREPFRIAPGQQLNLKDDVVFAA